MMLDRIEHFIDQLPRKRQLHLARAAAAIHCLDCGIETLPIRVAPWLRELTGGDVIGYGEADPARRERRAWIDQPLPGFADVRAKYVAHRDSHRFWQMDPELFSRGPLRQQDVFGAMEFRALRMYREVYQPAGVTAIMQVAWAVPGGRVGFGAMRLGGPSFSLQDRAAFGAILPHLKAARELAWHRTLRRLGPEQRVELLYPQLTRRQRDVLHWLMQGKENPVIARLLGVGIDAVKQHLKAIYLALQVDSRMAALNRLYESDCLMVPFTGAIAAAEPVPVKGPRAPVRERRRA